MNHSRIDEWSVAFGRIISARLRADPSLVEHALDNIDRWTASGSPRVAPALAEWKEALQGPLDGVIRLLTGTDEDATRLRQSNTFAGVLTADERNAVIRQFH